LNTGQISSQYTQCSVNRKFRTLSGFMSLGYKCINSFYSFHHAGACVQHVQLLTRLISSLCVLEMWQRSFHGQYERFYSLFAALFKALSVVSCYQNKHNDDAGHHSNTHPLFLLGQHFIIEGLTVTQVTHSAPPCSEGFLVPDTPSNPSNPSPKPRHLSCILEGSNRGPPEPNSASFADTCVDRISDV
jgi:hypothetical protein